MDNPAELAADGIRKHASTIAAGIAGVSTIAVLAAGSLTPLIAAYATGTLTAPVVADWIGGISGNVLATWLDQWARGTAARVLSSSKQDEQAVISALARDLQPLLTTEPTFVSAITTLIERTNAYALILTALQGRTDEQTRFLRLLLEDLQRATFRNERLHDVTIRTVLDQGKGLLTAIAASEERLRDEMTAILAAIRDMATSNRARDQHRISSTETVNGDRSHANTPTSIWPTNIPNEPYYRLPKREQTLSRLIDEFQAPHSPKTIVIDGLGGLGKTALATELARRMLDAGFVEHVVGDSAKSEVFAGGEIVQLPEARLDFDRLLDTIARQLGRWDIPVMRLEEKRHAIAYLLQAQRCLILVDNLETATGANEIAARLQGLLGNSRAVITSRKRVQLDSARSLTLSGLDQDDALEFLRKDAAQRHVVQILDAPLDRLLHIYSVTGGAPLAMKLVVSQARFLDLHLILQPLEKAKSQLYFFIYRQSWDQLSLAAKKLLIYIGRTVVTTVDLDELRDTQLIPDATELVAAIEQLVAYSLLEVSFKHDRNRYSLHQLTRHFVNSDLPQIWHSRGRQQ